VIALVEGHGEVGLDVAGGPLGDNGLLVAVDDGDVMGVGDVDEDSLAVLFELEGFGVTFELDVGDFL
jgi:hypothetical protein